MSVNPIRPDSPGLSVPVTLIGPLAAAGLTDGIRSDVTLSRTMDGATTLTFDVADRYRILSKSGLLNEKSYAVCNGLRFVLASWGKTGDTVTLTFEDSIVAALKSKTSPRTIAAANTSTRQQIAQLLAAEATVTIVCDPTKRINVADAIVRNETLDAGSSGTKADNKYVADSTSTDSSWTILQSLASGAGWRCFSDGKRLLFGSDAWLQTLIKPVEIAEHVDPIGAIDWSFDTGQDTATATAEVSVQAWTLAAGYPVKVSGTGAADGIWLLDTYTAPLNRNARAGTLNLVKAQPVLPESVAASTDLEGDDGDTDFLPTDDDESDVPDPGTAAYRNYMKLQGLATSGSDPSLTSGTSGARKKFLQFALAQSGLQYIYGTSGPKTYDCSGLVQQAVKAADDGITLPKPATAQLAKCKKLGVTIPVDVALKTRGALLFRIGYPNLGPHVAISLGDGQTMEARGKAQGVGVFPNAAKRHWTAGALPL